MAHKFAKEKRVLNSEAKLYMATDYVISQLTKSGLVEFTQEEIANRIETFLGSSAYEMNNMKKIDHHVNELFEGLNEEEVN